MPYQRKNKDLITISPTLDRVLYTAIQTRGYSISEIINMAFSAVLEIDGENLVRFSILQEAKERLESEYYREMIEKAKAKMEEKKRLEAEAAAKNEIHDKILNIVIETFRPATPEKIRSLEIEFQERCWNSSSVTYTENDVKLVKEFTHQLRPTQNYFGRRVNSG